MKIHNFVQKYQKGGWKHLTAYFNVLFFGKFQWGKNVKYVGFTYMLFKKFLMSLYCISENTNQCYASWKKCSHRDITWNNSLIKSDDGKFTFANLFFLIVFRSTSLNSDLSFKVRCSSIASLFKTKQTSKKICWFTHAKKKGGGGVIKLPNCMRRWWHETMFMGYEAVCSHLLLFFYF